MTPPPASFEPLPAGATPCVLLGIDLEDVRLHAADAGDAPCRVRRNVERLLAFCDERALRLTWFVVGQVARDFPDLVGRIAAAGHEVACHSDRHRDLGTLDPDGFRADTERNLEALRAAGVDDVVGYRSPYFSLVPGVEWIWDVLAELGFRYSSSVRPAAGGWPGFPPRVVRHPSGVWEMPVSTTGWPLADIPFAGGAYLRLLPSFLVQHLAARRLRDGRSVVGHVHPYDIDAADTRFRIVANPLANRVLYYNRGSTLPKVAALAQSGDCVTYRAFVDRAAALAAT